MEEFIGVFQNAKAIAVFDIKKAFEDQTVARGPLQIESSVWENMEGPMKKKLFGLYQICVLRDETNPSNRVLTRHRVQSWNDVKHIGKLVDLGMPRQVQGE